MTARYHDGRYLAENPRWHAEDAPHKADGVLRMIDRLGWRPATVIDVGCGSGDVLVALRRRLDATGRAGTTLAGWDPSADAASRWRTTGRVTLHHGDPIAAGAHADLVLALDVSEHLDDDVAFLASLRRVAPRVILRMPLDDSLLDTLRPSRKLAARARYGHVHAYTRRRALARVAEAGWRVVGTAYDRVPPGTGTARQVVVDAVRRLSMRAVPDLAVDVLGGWSLIVAAE